MVGQDLGKSAAQAWVWTSATTDRKQKQKKTIVASQFANLYYALKVL